MLVPTESAPHRVSPLPLPPALGVAELGPVVMADDPCEAASWPADPPGPRKYYRARYYDPKIGRFISEDPIGGSNLYAYVDNSPTNFIDPAGLAAVDPNSGPGQYLNNMGPVERMLFPLDFVAPMTTAPIKTAQAVKVIYEQHHVFPQALRDLFRRTGINIDKYLVKLPREWHKQWLHKFGERGGQWNAAWRKFFAENPNATADEIWEQLRTMIDDIGFCPRK